MFILYICCWTVAVEVRAHTNGHVPLPDARTQSIPLAVEAYVISDYNHTVGLQMLSLNASEYMETYMYKVSLQLQQLSPPVHIALVGYSTTTEGNADYISSTDTGDLDADGTVTKLRQYAGKSTSVQQSDLVILVTGSRIVDVSEKFAAPEMLGIAPFEGICSNYSVAVVKDKAGWYTGVHSMVHEMGHLFGSCHDGEDTATSCPASHGYIMSPSSHGNHSEKFSDCSKAAISKYISSDAARCLRYAASVNAIGVYPRKFTFPSHEDTSDYEYEESYEN
ncbi:A disintegrin and metalloproteinase with thrombospondin motifs 16 [Rhipicephalus sanguineus]|uniref:A disintegrin and metalloproteinase with thrombospondin motifs 16 n=1 Tax=Rhipicephalus sanguineus TaxID=34632 RepID=UPI0018950A2C|nr:A disintegrin and metalloproteinase with thrombospondin motifs 16 [Rhipicephalus sanguineus]